MKPRILWTAYLFAIGTTVLAQSPTYPEEPISRVEGTLQRESNWACTTT